MPCAEDLEIAPCFEDSTWFLLPNSTFEVYRQAHRSSIQADMSGGAKSGAGVPGSSNVHLGRLDQIRAATLAIGRGSSKRKEVDQTSNVPLKRTRRSHQTEQRTASAVELTKNPPVAGSSSGVDAHTGGDVNVDVPSTVVVSSSLAVPKPNIPDVKGKAAAAAGSRRQTKRSSSDCPTPGEVKEFMDSFIARYASLVSNNCELKTIVARLQKENDKKTSDLEAAGFALMESKDSFNALNLELITVRAEAGQKEAELDAQVKALTAENTQLNVQLSAAKNEIVNLTQVNDQTFEAYEAFARGYE